MQNSSQQYGSHMLAKEKEISTLKSNLMQKENELAKLQLQSEYRASEQNKKITDYELILTKNKQDLNLKDNELIKFKALSDQNKQ